MTTSVGTAPHPKVVRTEKSGGVGVLTMDNPAYRNALNTSKGGSEEQIAAALLELEDDDDVRVVIITGSGPAFCAGADYRSQGSAAYTMDQVVSRTLAERRDGDESKSWALWSLLEQYTKPLIAAVSGYAIGGGWELALYCDLIIADKTAKFALTNINLGLTTAHASLWLTRMIGRARAAELVYSARMVSAEEVNAMGGLSRYVTEGTALDEAQRLAADMAQHPAVTLQANRLALRRGAMQLGEWRLNQREFVLLNLSDSVKAERARWKEKLSSKRAR